MEDQPRPLAIIRAWAAAMYRQTDMSAEKLLSCLRKGWDEERTSFCEQKEAKNFICFWPLALQHRAKRSKSFLVLFFKKELLDFT